MFIYVGVATDDVGKNAVEAIEAASRGVFRIPGDICIDSFIRL